MLYVILCHNSWSICAATERLRRLQLISTDTRSPPPPSYRMSANGKARAVFLGGGSFVLLGGDIINTLVVQLG